MQHRTKPQSTPVILCLGFISCLLAGNPALAQTVSQGEALLRKGWVNDAISVFQQVLHRQPDSLAAQLGLATAYQRAGQDQQAWDLYHQVLKQDPHQRSALVAIGQLGSYRPEWQSDGIAALSTLLQLTPTDHESLAQRALLLGYQGQFAAAIADYEPLLAAHPKPDVILGAAQVYTYSGDYSQALVWFDRYQSLKLTLPDQAVTAYAMALRETDQPAQAVQVLASRLQSHSQLDAIGIELRAGLAVAYEVNGQAEAAIATLAPLHNLPEAALPLARTLSQIGRQRQDSAIYQSAIAYYRQVLQRSSQPPAPLQLEVADVMSEALTAQAEALKLYEHLQLQQPETVSLAVKQRVLAQQLGQISSTELVQQLQALPLPSTLSEQKAFATALIKLDTPDPELLPLYQALLPTRVPFLQFRIAQMQMQSGDLTAATAALTAYQQAKPQDQAADLLMADIERQAGNLKASADRYSAILAQNPKPTIALQAKRGLIGVRQAQGRTADAIEIYDQLLAQNPTDSRSQLGKASLAYSIQRMTQAEAETVLAAWLQQHPSETPPELFSLVAVLPADLLRETLYQRLATIAPRNLAIQMRLVQVLARRSPVEAQARIQHLIAQNPEDLTPYLIQAELAQSLGQLALAGQAYETILQRQPHQVGALSALAGVRFQQQRFSEAQSLYQQVLMLQPNDRATQQALAELSAAQDRPATALQQLQALSSTNDQALHDRIEQAQVELLKRRGFQPYWEQY